MSITDGPTDLEVQLIKATDARLAAIPPSAGQFAVERFAANERIAQAAKDWRRAERDGEDATDALLRLRDVLDQDEGLGIGHPWRDAR